MKTKAIVEVPRGESVLEMVLPGKRQMNCLGGEKVFLGDWGTREKTIQINCK